MEDTEAGAGALYAASCITRDNDIRQGEREATPDTYVRTPALRSRLSALFALGFTRRPAHRAPCRAHMHRAQRTLRPLRARTGDLAPSRTPISMCVSDMCVCHISHMVCVCVKCTGSVHRGSLSLCRVCRGVLTIINRYGVREINTLRGARATAGSRGTHTTHVTRTCATQCHTDALRVRLVTCTHPASGRLPAPGSAGPRAGCARGARGSRAPLG